MVLAVIASCIADGRILLQVLSFYLDLFYLVGEVCEIMVKNALGYNSQNILRLNLRKKPDEASDPSSVLGNQNSLSFHGFVSQDILFLK